jgi:hypothetical protein
MAYYEQQTPPEDGRSGCLDVFVILRAVLGLLMWPFIAVVVIVADLVAIVTAFSVHPALALLPVGLTAAAVLAYARWEQRHFRPPDA